MRQAADKLGYLANQVPAILVAGTNGKGTTSGAIWQMLTLAGYKVGLYTSPHLVDFRERFVVGRELVDDKVLNVELAYQQEQLRELFEELSFFEISTLLALGIFQKTGCEFQVLEVGLGGRWDATNIVAPILSVVTSIGIDHQEFLGNSISGIAREKAGIFRKDVPAIWGDIGNQETTALIKQLAEECGAIYVPAEQIANINDCSIPNISYLKKNISAAMTGLKFLAQDGTIKKNFSDVYNFESLPYPASLRGRFEIIHRPNSDPLILDICHNVDGVKEFLKAFVNVYGANSGAKAFVSILRDKNYCEILYELQQVFQTIELFTLEGERFWRQDDLCADHKSLYFHPSSTSVISELRSSKVLSVVCGSALALQPLFEAFPRA